MTGPARSRAAAQGRASARRHARRAPLPIGLLLLVITAILWCPLAARTAAGGATGLPALRSMVEVAPVGVSVAGTHRGDRRLPSAAALLSALLGTTALAAARRTTLRPAPDDHTLHLHLVLGDLRSRAPPLAA